MRERAIVASMRPPGVRQRIESLLDSEWHDIHSRPERLLRVNLTSFVSLCGRLWYSDHPVTTVLKRYHEVCTYLDDPSQVKTHSDFENKSIACVEQLRPEIEELAGTPAENISFDEQEGAREPLLRVPPLTLLGEVNPECYFHLVCWNEANSLMEGVQARYRAARQIANMGFHNPADPYSLVEPLTDLAVRGSSGCAQRDRRGDCRPARDVHHARALVDGLTCCLPTCAARPVAARPPRGGD